MNAKQFEQPGSQPDPNRCESDHGCHFAPRCNRNAHLFAKQEARADVSLENQQLEKAESLFAQLVETGERRNFRIPLAMVYFGLAYIHLETRREASGLAYARKALHLIEASRVVQLFLVRGCVRGW